MDDNELIETLKQFDKKKVEQLPENARRLFYVVMKICDRNDILENENKKLKVEVSKWKKKYGKI